MQYWNSVDARSIALMNDNSLLETLVGRMPIKTLSFETLLYIFVCVVQLSS